MNRYGQIALDYWITYRPAQIAQMSDPQAWATQIGEQIKEQVISAQQDAPIPDEASYLQIVNAQKAAGKIAEEQALNELVYLTPEPGTEDRRMSGLSLPGWEQPLPPKSSPAAQPN